MRMYCVVSKESMKKFQGIRGKMMSQSGHAFLHAFWDSNARFPETAKAYQESAHARKITVIVETDKDLLDLYAAYKPLCGAVTVVDAGFTVFKEPTLTCIGIGPLRDDAIGENLKSLKTLS